MSQDVEIELTVNGHRRGATVEARTIVADLLRDEFGMTGTHLGCEHGVCGACTVLVDGEAARSCLLLVGQVHGADVVTIEGLSADGEFGPLHEALAASHSFQCGFYTPGFLMQITSLLADDPDPSEATIREELSGNLCRCTGYESIIDGVLRFTRGDPA